MMPKIDSRPYSGPDRIFPVIDKILRRSQARKLGIAVESIEESKLKMLGNLALAAAPGGIPILMAKHHIKTLKQGGPKALANFYLSKARTVGKSLSDTMKDKEHRMAQLWRDSGLTETEENKKKDPDINPDSPDYKAGRRKGAFMGAAAATGVGLTAHFVGKALKAARRKNRMNDMYYRPHQPMVYSEPHPYDGMHRYPHIDQSKMYTGRYSHYMR